MVQVEAAAEELVLILMGPPLARSAHCAVRRARVADTLFLPPTVGQSQSLRAAATPAAVQMRDGSRVRAQMLSLEEWEGARVGLVLRFMADAGSPLQGHEHTWPAASGAMRDLFRRTRGAVLRGTDRVLAGESFSVGCGAGGLDILALAAGELESGG